MFDQLLSKIGQRNGADGHYSAGFFRREVEGFFAIASSKGLFRVGQQQVAESGIHHCCGQKPAVFFLVRVSIVKLKVFVKRLTRLFVLL